MNVNNYGFPLYFSTGYNMAAATNVAITFTRPDGTTFTRDFNSVPNPVYVGQVNVTVALQQQPCVPPPQPSCPPPTGEPCCTPSSPPGSALFTAFQYAGYLIAPGDINQAGNNSTAYPGQWSARVTYTNSVLPEQLTSDIAYFTVDP